MLGNMITTKIIDALLNRTGTDSALNAQLSLINDTAINQHFDCPEFRTILDDFGGCVDHQKVLAAMQQLRFRGICERPMGHDERRESLRLHSIALLDFNLPKWQSRPETIALMLDCGFTCDQTKRLGMAVDMLKLANAPYVDLFADAAQPIFDKLDFSKISVNSVVEAVSGHDSIASLILKFTREKTTAKFTRKKPKPAVVLTIADRVRPLLRDGEEWSDKDDLALLCVLHTLTAVLINQHVIASIESYIAKIRLFEEFSTFFGVALRNIATNSLHVLGDLPSMYRVVTWHSIAQLEARDTFADVAKCDYEEVDPLDRDVAAYISTDENLLAQYVAELNAPKEDYSFKYGELPQVPAFHFDTDKKPYFTVSNQINVGSDGFAQLMSGAVGVHVDSSDTLILRAVVDYADLIAWIECGERMEKSQGGSDE